MMLKFVKRSCIKTKQKTKTLNTIRINNDEKSNQNYTNFDSYEFAEIKRYPYPVSVSGIRIRYPYPVSVSAIRYLLPAFSTMPDVMVR